MHTSLVNLEHSKVDNYGGIPYFLFAPKEWVDAFSPDIRTRIVTDTVTLTVGKSWLKADCLVDTCGYEEKQKDDLGSSYFEAILTGLVKRDNITKGNLTNALRFHEYVAVYYDRNNIGRIIGDNEHGLRFRSDFTTGIKSLDDTMYGFSFAMKLEERAPLYQPSGSSSGGGSGGSGDPDPNNPTS